MLVTYFCVLELFWKIKRKKKIIYLKQKNYSENSYLHSGLSRFLQTHKSYFQVFIGNNFTTVLQVAVAFPISKLLELDELEELEEVFLLFAFSFAVIAAAMAAATAVTPAIALAVALAVALAAVPVVPPAFAASAAASSFAFAKILTATGSCPSSV